MLLFAADTPALATELMVRALRLAHAPFLLILLSQLDESSLKPDHWNYLQPPSTSQVGHCCIHTIPTRANPSTPLQASKTSRRQTVLSRAPPPPRLLESDRQALASLLESFVNLGFDAALQRQLWTVVAAVLHLGNVTFEATQGAHLNDSCAIAHSRR
jgi:hypothetical protein